MDTSAPVSNEGQSLLGVKKQPYNGSSGLKGLLIAVCILVIGLALTYYLWGQTERNLSSQSNQQFDDQVQKTTNIIQNRFILYTNLLTGAQGLFKVKGNLTRADWTNYVKTIDLAKNYLGASSMSYISYVKDSQKADFLKSLQQDKTATSAGYPDARIHPESDNPDHYLYTFVEPSTNLVSSLALDIGTDETRKQALEHARDSGRPTGTGLILSLSANKEKSFVTYMPIFEGSNSAQLKGFVTIGLQTKKFFESVIEQELLKSGLNFEIYDTAQPTDEHLLYDTNQESQDALATGSATLLHKVAHLPIVERDWNIYFQAQPDFGLTVAEKELPTVIGIGGSVLSLLLAIIIYNLSNSRGRAVSLATKMTAKLKSNENFLGSIIDNLPNMVFVKEAKDLRFVTFNKAGADLLGLKQQEMIGKNDYDLFSKEQADFFTNKDRDVLVNRQLVDIPSEKITSKTNGELILHTKKIPIYDENGKPEYLLGISEDITVKDKAEQELKERTAEAERLNKITIDRELKMIELKKELDEIKQKTSS